MIQRRSFLSRLFSLLGVAVAAKAVPASTGRVSVPLHNPGDVGDLYGRAASGQLVRLTPPSTTVYWENVDLARFDTRPRLRLHDSQLEIHYGNGEYQPLCNSNGEPIKVETLPTLH